MARKKRSYSKKTTAVKTAAEVNAAPAVSQATENKPEIEKEVIRLKEFVQDLVAKQPSLGGLKEKELVEFLTNAFGVLKEKMDSEQDKVVILNTIGRFRVTNFEREVDGEMKSGRRMLFVPAKPKVV